MVIYKCFYTGKEVSEEEVIWTGAYMPYVKMRIPCAPGYEPYRKASVRVFDEFEAVLEDAFQTYMKEKRQTDLDKMSENAAELGLFW